MADYLVVDRQGTEPLARTSYSAQQVRQSVMLLQCYWIDSDS